MRIPRLHGKSSSKIFWQRWTNFLQVSLTLTGSGKSLKVLDYTKDSLVKKSIKNSDNLYCGRALVVGQLLADSHVKLKQLKIGRPIQKKLALELYKKVLSGLCGLREVSKFQGVLPGYQIIVIDFNARDSSIYESSRRDKKIVIYKNGDHYDVINPKKLLAFHAKCLYCKSRFIQIIVHIIVVTHVIRAWAKNVFGFRLKIAWSRKERNPLETSKSDPEQKTLSWMKTMNTILQKTTYWHLQKTQNKINLKLE